MAHDRTRPLAPGWRYRCDACGNVTRFDVVESARTRRYVHFDLGGHQIVAHLVEEGQRAPGSNAVDGKNVPAFHFGLVLSMERWRGLADRLRGAGVEFLIEPYVRNEGEVGEQATLFVRDPAGNALEFKAFDDLGQLFAT